MTLDEFLAEEVKRLEQFKAFWLAEAKKNPDQYPMDLMPGDWDEQLHFSTVS